MVKRASKPLSQPANDNAPETGVVIRVPCEITLAELVLLESIAADLIVELASKVANDNEREPRSANP